MSALDKLVNDSENIQKANLIVVEARLHEAIKNAFSLDKWQMMGLPLERLDNIIIEHIDDDLITTTKFGWEESIKGNTHTFSINLTAKLSYLKSLDVVEAGFFSYPYSENILLPLTNEKYDLEKVQAINWEQAMKVIAKL